MRGRTITDQERRYVTVLVSAGVRQDEIAGLLEIDPKSLRRHFLAELDEGMRRSREELQSNLLALALNSRKRSVRLRASMQILRQEFGWDEKAGRPG